MYSDHTLANGAKRSSGTTTIPCETDMWHSPKQARRKLSGKLRSAHLLWYATLAGLRLLGARLMYFNYSWMLF